MYIMEYTYELCHYRNVGDHSHDWSAAMDSYKLFRKNWQGRRGGGVALYVKECFEVTELMTGDDKVESL